jgi:hypothetical protein
MTWCYRRCLPLRAAKPPPTTGISRLTFCRGGILPLIAMGFVCSLALLVFAMLLRVPPRVVAVLPLCDVHH